uniref:Zinc finger FYVE domain-containing protein n=1 Tax=Esox lucius TaxID=8010 RepID=A0A3P8XUD2_ESOLU
MENYFQAEAFNLDKVLDDFEQNQDDDTDSPTLSDAKWSQILAPPTHLLSLNPALALSPDLSPTPRDSPLSFKTFVAPEPPSNGSLGPDAKRHLAAEPPPWGEERPDHPQDVHSPLLPQANIGKLVGGEEGSSPPVSASSSPPPYHQQHLLALKNGCTSRAPPNSGRPALNGHSGAPCGENQGSSGNATDDPDDPLDEDRSGGDEVAQVPGPSTEMERGDPQGKPEVERGVPQGRPEVEGGDPQGRPEVEQGDPQDRPEVEGGDSQGRPEVEQGDPQDRERGQAQMTGSLALDNGERGRLEKEEMSENGSHQKGRMIEGLREGKGESRNTSQKENWLKGEEEKRGRQCHGGNIALSNGLSTAWEEEKVSQEEVVKEEEDGQSLTPPFSKEDSVTEEKEIEESKQENEGGGAERAGPDSAPSKLNNRLQPVSVPFGGARPKQPVGLKLHTPRTLSGQVHNQLEPPAPPGGKNKNLDAQCRVTTDTATMVAGGDPGVFVNGELLNRGSSSSSGVTGEAESSPDNDLQAGQHHQGALPRKQLSTLGDVAPVWVPDSQAPSCMKCEARFTFTKRRHHCRACGKVFCAVCCSLKSRLGYMDRKEARVCVTCHSTLLTAHSWEGGVSSPNPNNPADYCSTVPPLLQASAPSTPPTVMVPVGVLNPPASEGSLSREQRRVWFADGILPNGEAAESLKAPDTSPAPSLPLAVSHLHCTSLLAFHHSCFASSSAPVAQVGSPVGSSVSLIPEDGLPPILISTQVKGDYAVEEHPSEIVLMQHLEGGGPDPLVFVLNANLLAMVKLVNYVNRKCWYVSSKGMHAVGQVEVVVLLQCLPDEKSIPKDIFSHFVQLYQEALSGNVLTHLGHSFFTQSFLGSREHGGFLYISPSFQSLQDLMLPNPPYLFGVLLQKWETPWAKVFPIRLMLRLGAEYRFYPCPLFSVRFRRPLFGETGHTIMNLLADFRNYQYTLPSVKGLVVDMEVKKTCIKIPSNRYDELMKAMNKSNEHVLAMGACFNEQADSHLVCVQNDDGNYQTQAISIHHQPRKVTGACFFVFSGALKAASGYLAKTSIVEDGVMVQITGETMEALRQALRDMKGFSITCGRADQEDTQEHVHIQWIDDDHSFNKGVISPIDGKSMESISSVKIFQGSEFKASGKVIRWTEVFFLQSDDQDRPSGLSDPADHSRLTENVAKAFCVALCPHLKMLKEDGMAKLGLRVTLDYDRVGYLAGSNGQALPPQYLGDLDTALIPVIHAGACQLNEGPVVMELVFYILEIIS